MAVTQRPAVPVAADVVDLESALSRIAYLMARAKQHHRIAAEAHVPVDRAAVPILRLLSGTGPQRPGELAARLAVEAPHITRQIQHALAHWSAQDRDQLATLFHRMVDDFLAQLPDS
jgi:hypothetical protein